MNKYIIISLPTDILCFDMCNQTIVSKSGILLSHTVFAFPYTVHLNHVN